MRTGIRVRVLALCFGVVIGGIQQVGAGETKKEVTILRADAPIVIDGKAEEAGWEKAPPLKLTAISVKRPLTAGTAARLLYDDENLYVLVRCEEPKPGHVVLNWANMEERDNAIFRDDCIELLFDPHSRGLDDGPPATHIVINTAGVWYDAWSGDRGWDCDLKAAVVKGESEWVLEAAVPFRDLGFAPKGGERWEINIARERQNGPEYSSFGRGTGNLGNPSRYVPARFEGGKDVFVESLGRPGNNVVRLRMVNAAKTAKTYEGAVYINQRGTRMSTQRLQVKAAPGKTATLDLNYAPQPGRQTMTVLLRTMPDKIVLYQNSFTIDRTDGKPKPIVFQVKDPLFEELLGDEPFEAVRKGTANWMHLANYGKMRQVALQYGVRYSYLEVMERQGRLKLSPYTNSYVLTTDYFSYPQHAKTYGFLLTHYVSPRGASLPEGIDGGRGGFLFLPDFRKAYIADAVKMLEEHGDILFATSVGDETTDHTEMELIHLFEEYGQDFAAVAEIDRHIKETYGAGQYGLPTSLTDPNPYRWIALRRYMTELMVDIHDDLYKAVKSRRPEVYVIGDDPVALHHGYGYSRIRGKLDIMAHQLYPRRDPNLAQFGFLTKTMADLTGAPEIHPVPHVENYGIKGTPEDVLELLSQVVRNGGTGFQLYLGDTIGGRKGKGSLAHEYYVAPDRWQAIEAVLTAMQTMNRPVFPEPDCAILYCTDTIGAAVGRNVTEYLPSMYMFAGPRAGAWFRFVDDYQLEAGDLDLSGFKVLLVPEAKYERKGAIDAMETYVRAGGILVATDPDIFSNYPDATDATARRKALFGVTVTGKTSHETVKAGKLVLPLLSGPRTLKLDKGVKVDATFEDGSPAVVSKALGRGRTYFFAFQPCTRRGIASKPWQQYFTALLKELGVKTGQDIWRFQFPKSLIKKLPEPTGRCLTNNFFIMQGGEVIETCNLPTGGSYTYSLAPQVRDNGGTKDVPFDAGDLTDRRQAPTAGDVASKKSNEAAWYVRWKKTDPFTIDFDLTADYPVDKVKLWYARTAPGVTVLLSQDGKQWTEAAEVTNAEQPERLHNVLDLTIDFEATPARFVRLAIGGRAKGELLDLVEVEIWSPSAGE